MSIVSGIRDYLIGYAGLAAGAPVWVNYMGPKPTEYSVVPMPGPRYSERYTNGGYLREYPFAFSSSQYTAADLDRVSAEAFFEAFGDWLDSQTEAGTFPDVGAKLHPWKIEATDWGYLMEEGQSDTGRFQVTCKLYFSQEP